MFENGEAGVGFWRESLIRVPPLEMASPLEILRNRLGCSAALRCCVAAVALILTVDFRGLISEVDCHFRPR